MKSTVVAALALAAFAASASAQIQTARVAEDARTIDRVAEASKRDLPIELLKRIVDEDLDILRGRRSDDTYLYASYERMEAGRRDESFSIQPADEGKFSRSEVKGSFVYKAILSLPSRRMVVTKNRPLWIERVEVEYIPQNGTAMKTQTATIQSWVTPGTSKTVDFDEVARQATVKVFARADKKNGYGNLDVTLVQAKVFDDPASPYADAVASAKAITRGLDHNDVPSVRAMAQRLRSGLERSPARVVEAVAVTPPPASTQAGSGSTVDVVESRVATGELQNELQAIEDLLTGSDAERRQGMDRLHQLLRRLRTSR